MLRLFCVSNLSYFNAFERLCFVVIAFPGYLHLYFSTEPFDF